MTVGMLGREIDLNCGAARLPFLRFPHPYARALLTTGMDQCGTIQTQQAFDDET